MDGMQTIIALIAEKALIFILLLNRDGSGLAARLYLRCAPTEPASRFHPCWVTILAQE
jgi:hypothetical protein